MDLAHNAVTTDLLALQRQEADINSGDYQQQKSHILTKLRRLQPGCNTAIGAIQTPDGNLAHTPHDIAQELGKHWSRIFTRQPVNPDI
eukprot:6527789-Pyramimonas_sp.AAC.1